jgi:hypothetical protein
MTMKSASIKFAFGALALAAASSASALSLTLTSFEANAVITFSSKSNSALNAVNISLAGLGNTVTLPRVSAGNDSRGNPITVPAFAFPATKTDVAIASVSGALPVKPLGGVASGSALAIDSPDTAAKMVLANFNIDFTKHIVYADLINAGTKATAKNQPLYTFVDVVTPKAVLKGLAINVHAELNTLVFTPTAVTALSTGLVIDEVIADNLKSLDWGGIVLDVTSKTRAKKINAAPFTAAMIK